MNIWALVGGVMIGLSAVGLLATHGKIAGISGILKGFFEQISLEDRLWRGLFLMGVVFGGGLVVFFVPQVTAGAITYPLWQAVLAGVLVGVGTVLGNGCTSGHGVCGLGRKSKRSFFSVLVFLLVGLLVMYVLTHVLALPRLSS